VTEIDLFFAYLGTQFPAITVHKGKTRYLGMLSDFREEGSVYVTMQGAVARRHLGRMRGGKLCATPAGNNLFVIRDASKVSEKEAIWCQSYVAKTP
jgi:hypothetical protein